VVVAQSLATKFKFVNKSLNEFLNIIH
jgi:hypothetical protein